MLAERTQCPSNERVLKLIVFNKLTKCIERIKLLVMVIVETLHATSLNSQFAKHNQF